MLKLNSFIDHWITTFDLQAVRDILLEFLAVIGFIFLFAALIIAISKAPILLKHGSLEILFFVIFGFISSCMDVFDEFAWLGSYSYWKLVKDLLLLVGAVLLVIGFSRFFWFSSRLFGTKCEDKTDKFTQTE
ncbi:MAG: hypothetical protein JXA54_00165 [Candidatus Heimdallarchaeota archaeon]|nr:hypothetical protein [Candidatus Heimdallarchaeota archaeon]